MRFAFHMIGKLATQEKLHYLLTSGADKFGDSIKPVSGYSVPLTDVDAVIILGIGGHGLPSNRELFYAYRGLGVPVLIFDNGYYRKIDGEQYYRVSINSLQPLRYLTKVRYPIDRLRWLHHHRGLDIKPYDDNSKLPYILFDGANQSLCTWHGLGDQGIWAAMTVAKIKQHTSLPVVYRSKGGVTNVPGATVSIKSLEQDIAQARVVVSYGGNIGWDVVIAGTSHFAISESIVRPLSTVLWEGLCNPYIPTVEERAQWLSNVCYCQWSALELDNGTAWPHIRYQMELARG